MFTIPPQAVLHALKEKLAPALKGRRTRVYVAGPIRKGDLFSNVKQADDAMNALMVLGFAPFNPMLSVYAGGVRRGEHVLYEGNKPPYAEADPHAKLVGVTAEDWLTMDLAWVEVSHAVLRLPGESTGADGEVAFARDNNVPVFYTLDELVEYFS